MKPLFYHNQRAELQRCVRRWRELGRSTYLCTASALCRRGLVLRVSSTERLRGQCLPTLYGEQIIGGAT